ncbi:MAG: hypothetical protein PHY64_10710, partial [Eubacteriales bacterium]|nr:hypothetical protein [Eubacteriales bacterium]
LSLLLGWLRSLFNAVWTLLGSSEGNSFFTLLRNNWKIIFIVLCVGGFVVDRIIYLIRWRPYYVWRSRRRWKRSRKQARRSGAYERDADYAQNADPAEYTADYDAYPEAQYDAYHQPYENDNPYDGPEEPEETTRYQGPAAPPAANAGFAPTYRYNAREAEAEPTQVAPPLSYAQQQAEAPTSVYRPPFEPNAGFAPTIAFPSYREPTAPPEDTRFDDDLAAWRSPQTGFQDFAPRYTPRHQSPAPAAEPETDTERYLRDVRSGFAPPPTPEQLYSGGPDANADSPVHPGLDIAAFRQNLGLDREDGSAPNAGEGYDRFAPFTSTRNDAQPDRPRVLGSLAKKARTFVSGEDESNPPTIRDLQSTVDVSTAFHAPVYPKKNTESEDE